MSQQITKTSKRTSRKRAGGPKTPAGRARSALNSVKHGIQSLAILPHERNAYLEHKSKLFGALEPVGYLEERLAERVSLTMWRIQRVELFEAAKLEQQTRLVLERSLYGSPFGHLVPGLASKGPIGVRPVESLDLNEVMNELELQTYELPHTALTDWERTQRRAEEMRRAGEALQAFYDTTAHEQRGIEPTELSSLPDEARLALAFSLKRILEDTLEVPAESSCRAVFGDEVTAETVEAWLAEDWVWTPEQLIALWEHYCREHRKAQDPVNRPQVVAYRAGSDLARKGQRIPALMERARALIQERQAQALALSEKDAQKIQRYEAHLERVLYRALHELEAHQKRRLGADAPLGRLEVYGTDEPSRG